MYSKCKRKVVFCFMWSILLPGLIFSQGKEFRPVSNLSTFKSNLRKEAANIKTIQSNFEQRKVLAVLEEELKSSGEFYFKREDKVKIKYTDPFYYIMIVNGDQILIKDDVKENKINLGSSRLFKQVNGIILDAIQGTILDNKDFESQVMESNNNYLLKLKPVSKGLGELFSVIFIYLDREDFSVDQIEMMESSGDTTVMSFSNKKLNNNVSDEEFAIH